MAEVRCEIVPRVCGLHVRTGGFLEEEDAAISVIHEEEIPLVAHLAVGDELFLGDKVVVPVGDVAEVHCLPSPVAGAQGKVVKDRPGNGLGGHVGGGFYVLVVPCRCRLSGEVSAQGATEIGVAGDGGDIGIYAEVPPYLNAA